ncbi:MAG TPA: hypothetical protein VGD17_13145 [Chitinophagaceae bacterium]
MKKGKNEPGNLRTKPADNPDKDKLRENPHNDEKVIYQKDPEPGSNPELKTGSTFAQKDAEGMNRVTNEQEQNQVVNPGVGDLQGSSADKAENSDRNPYETTSGDPEERKKDKPNL